MRYYELTYLASSLVSEEDAKNLQQKITSSIQNKEGLLDSSIDPVMTDLYYPIKKEIKAYLGTITFYLKSEGLNNLEKEVKAEKDILRFLLFTRKKIRVEKPAKKPPVKKPKKKVELKDIEKKLDEILE